MGTFTTKLKLGQKAFVVYPAMPAGVGIPSIERCTVGQIRVIQTHPSLRVDITEPCYIEDYMCIETGVGTGAVWRYGKNIFANKYEAELAVKVMIERSRMEHERKEREAYRMKCKEEAGNRALELLELARLKAKYEGSDES